VLHTLYATDGSDAALAGAHLLARLPLRENWHVTLLTVLSDGESSADAAQQPALEALRNTPAGIRTEVRWGKAGEEILRAARHRPTDLLVVGTRGRSGLPRILLGSVAEHVVRHAPCPVLLARPLRNSLREALVGVDGSDEARAAVEWLHAFPLPDDCAVRLVTVMPPAATLASPRRLHEIPEQTALYQEQLEETRERLQALITPFVRTDRTAIAEVPSGEPAETLIQVATKHQADLIAVGSRGAGGIERVLLGSVSDRLVRDAPCSVLVFRRSDRKDLFATDEKRMNSDGKESS
jgi:nucleotide-binding universal stress UspA family protein